MKETIMLPIEHLGAIIELPLTIITLGYSYQLHIQIDGKMLIFEKDEQGEYRVIEGQGGAAQIDRSLVAAILKTLQEL